MMSEPIKESKETKSAREKGMEAWAASIAARQSQTPQMPGPEQELASGGTSRSDASQRPRKIKTVTKTQETHSARKKDSVDLARSAEKSEPELTMKSARELVKGRTAPPANQISAPVQPQLQTPVQKTEKAVREAVTQQVAESAETVTAEEVQASPALASTVAVSSSKKADKSEKAEKVSQTEVAEESEEDVPSLIEPGNSPLASAYVRAGDMMNHDSSNPDLDDFLLAL
jgi:hypothetical protein